MIPSEVDVFSPVMVLSDLVEEDDIGVVRSVLCNTCVLFVDVMVDSVRLVVVVRVVSPARLGVVFLFSLESPVSPESSSGYSVLLSPTGLPQKPFITTNNHANFYIYQSKVIHK